ncbi:MULTISPECIES: Clp protease N-terminal domain-containing protein [Nocardia]|uniref:Clp protease N-terminal domain-containing protein n=1 Tax=Nocardia TaxID=1817 RepID=UPI00142D964A|nr:MULTISPECIES: Clp protease N-terminal domain-containing protein [Nocardia]
MTSTDRDTTVTTITGAAPGVIIALRRAAKIAAEHGHNYIGTEDLLVALLNAEPMPLLEVHWQLRGGGALTFSELRELAESIVPGPAIGNHGPAEPARVEFEWTGPHAAAFTEAINRQS